jgi:hypothetical protein
LGETELGRLSRLGILSGTKPKQKQRWRKKKTKKEESQKKKKKRETEKKDDGEEDEGDQEVSKECWMLTVHPEKGVLLARVSRRRIGFHFQG